MVLVSVHPLKLILVVVFCQINHVLVWLGDVRRSELAANAILVRVVVVLHLNSARLRVGHKMRSWFRLSHELLILFFVEVTIVVGSQFSLVECLETALLL